MSDRKRERKVYRVKAHSRQTVGSCDHPYIKFKTHSVPSHFLTFIQQ